ncbi:MAG: hypothetical protein H0X33_08825 [Taibaiella sp.]|nr:hypothetical protein [Taibaiella sp.]
MASPLFVLRIGLGMIMCLQFIHLFPDLMGLLSKNGIVKQDIANVQLAVNLISSDKIVNLLMVHFKMDEIASLHLLGSIYIGCLLFFVAGLFTRTSAILCWLLHLAFVNSGFLFTYGVDYFITMLLFYCIIFPVGREFSLDKLLFKYKPVNHTPYIRALQIHLCIVYLVSGVSKAAGINWWNGVSVYKAVNRPNVAAFFLHVPHMVYVVSGIATVVIEVLYVFFINYNKTKKLWLYLTCSMHLGIALFLQLPYFAAIMMLLNMVAFYYPAQLSIRPKAKFHYSSFVKITPVVE